MVQTQSRREYVSADSVTVAVGEQYACSTISKSDSVRAGGSGLCTVLCVYTLTSQQLESAACVYGTCHNTALCVVKCGFALTRLPAPQDIDLHDDRTNLPVVRWHAGVPLSGHQLIARARAGSPGDRSKWCAGGECQCISCTLRLSLKLKIKADSKPKDERGSASDFAVTSHPTSAQLATKWYTPGASSKTMLLPSSDALPEEMLLSPKTNFPFAQTSLEPSATRASLASRPHPNGIVTLPSTPTGNASVT